METLNFEKQENKRGTNVQIHNYWIRHSQKASGEVFNSAGNAISTSSLSPEGVKRAVTRGMNIKASKDGAKGYTSTSPRTQETFDGLMQGYQENNPFAPIKEKVRVREALLSPSGTKEWMAEYDAKWSANKKIILMEGIKEGKYPDTEFAKLTSDQQEEIAEAAEEPVIREWIDNPDSTLAKKFPPKIQAAKFANLFNQRHERIAQKLNPNSEIDLFNTTHKTATEPFLASGVLIREKDNQRITKLSDIEGSLKILDQWESITKTDEQGNPITVIKIRGENYKIDQEIYNQLLAKNNK